ncbi:TIGR03790 family protein [Haloferula chungangensis]|uniref:TIGR03790 family protein n=1 Tax=Haloferula chungangensis TaxID=1048331 RepID=A0ABW2L9P2_9BACT
MDVRLGHGGSMFFVRDALRKLTLLSLLFGMAFRAAALVPENVVVLYNSSDPESEEIAQYYRQARGIPEGNLVGLALSQKPQISRDEYNRTIRDPLRKIYEDRQWWELGKNQSGQTLPFVNRRPVLAIIRGVPLKIGGSPLPADFKSDPDDPISKRNEAAVDSELLLLGGLDAPIQGVAPNFYFEGEKRFEDSKLSFMLLISRIDAATVATCKRMIRDAIQIEKTGLWGRAYIDYSNRHQMGTSWLNSIQNECRAQGFATVADRFNQSFPRNYPLSDAALYYGWYDSSVSGPFLNPQFRLRPGSVAIHIHSYSAAQLRDASRNWSAPLLEKGAAATVGNVNEPFLQLTHRLDILNDRLMRGWTWAEASCAALPVSSWQSVALGDPLYRPFHHLDGSGEEIERDRDFRSLVKLARKNSDPGQRLKAIETLAAKQKSGILSEAAGLEALAQGKRGEAQKWFKAALVEYQSADNQIRQYLHLAAIARHAKQTKNAAGILKSGLSRAQSFPNSAALAEWLQIVEPKPKPKPKATSGS